MTTRILTAIALGVALALTLHAQVPGIINYQGRIVDGGTNFNGAGQFEFALVSPTGTTNYWSNDGTAAGQPSLAISLTLTKGLYSVLLGDTTVSNMTAAIPLAVFANPDVRLRVWFNDGVHGFQQLSPDQRIAAVGYAMVAATVPNGAITAAQLASNAVTAANLAPGAVTAAAIANGAVGANQLASNSVNSLIQSNFAASGVLVNGSGAYSISNQYYLVLGMCSTNAYSPGGIYMGQGDTDDGFLAVSPDAENLAFLSGQPVIGPNSGSFNTGSGVRQINEPTCWLGTNDLIYVTFSAEVDYATNLVTIYSFTGPTSAPTTGSSVSFNNLAGALGTSALWVIDPDVDRTPGIMPTNLFVSVSTNSVGDPGNWQLAVSTCLNPPAYTSWSTPRFVPVVDTNGNPQTVLTPHVFQYHGTNMVLYWASNQGDSLALATNTTSPTSTYVVWKTNDWGGFLAMSVVPSNGFGSIGAASVIPSSIVFLPDRIRIICDRSTPTTGWATSPSAYTDCFDLQGWNGWSAFRTYITPTPLPVGFPFAGPSAVYPGNSTNLYIRMACVCPISPVNGIYTRLPSWLGLFSQQFNGAYGTGIVILGPLAASGAITAPAGFTDSTGSNITSWTQLATGITNGNTTTFINNSSMVVLGSLNVSDRVSFGALQQVGVPIITNRTFASSAATNCFVYCDTSANTVSNVLPLIGAVGQIFGVANIGTAASNNLAVIDFGLSRTLTNNGSRYLSMYPGHHIIVQRINGSTYASLADNVFGGITTNIPILNASTNASTLYFTNGFFKGISTP